MKTTTKPNPQVTKSAAAKKPDGRPKVKLGTGKHLGFISDTLFDEDLKR